MGDPAQGYVTVLVLTNHEDATANFLCRRLDEAALNYIRLDTEAAATACWVEGSPEKLHLGIGMSTVAPNDLSTVWFRRPKPVKPPQISTDDAANTFSSGEWTAALEGFLGQIPPAQWMNHPARIMGASSKLEQLARARGIGLSVPDWICSVSTESARRFFERCAGNVVANPLLSGYLERSAPSDDSVIYTSRVSALDLDQQGPSLGAPTLLQKRLIRGLDVRVTIVDDAVHAVAMRRADEEVDIRRDNMDGVEYSPILLPEGLTRKLKRLVGTYALRFAAIDLMLHEGTWYFLEVNPNGQWAWLDLLGGASIHESFVQAFTKGMEST